MGLATYWRRIHHWPRRARWPLKTLILVGTVALVLFPKVWLIPVWIERLANLNSVLDLDNPGLAALEARVTTQAGEHASLEQVLRPVECAVEESVRYAFDWDTWGVMDYLPTVDEVFAEGREDCDGRAVVAASLLQRLGFSAWLATDLKHTWVVARDERSPMPTDVELMAPGKGEKTLTGEAGRPGTRLKLTLRACTNLARGLTFGVAVFPVGRELLILAALCAVTMHP